MFQQDVGPKIAVVLFGRSTELPLLCTYVVFLMLRVASPWGYRGVVCVINITAIQRVDWRTVRGQGVCTLRGFQCEMVMRVSRCVNASPGRSEVGLSPSSCPILFVVIILQL